MLTSLPKLEVRILNREVKISGEISRKWSIVSKLVTDSEIQHFGKYAYALMSVNQTWSYMSNQ